MSYDISMLKYIQIPKDTLYKMRIHKLIGQGKIAQPLNGIVCILYVAPTLCSWVRRLLCRTFFSYQKIYVTRQIRSPNLTIYKVKRNETFRECKGFNNVLLHIFFDTKQKFDIITNATSYIQYTYYTIERLLNFTDSLQAYEFSSFI